MTVKYPGKCSELVKSALSMCDSFEDVKSSGILFHGTPATIKGALHGGAYDGVFWTVDRPSIAQAYIPKAGTFLPLSEPLPHDRDEKIFPVRHQNFIMNWALERAGVEMKDLDVNWNGNRVSCWSIPKGWPTYGDLDDHIKSMGYHANKHGFYEISIRYDEESQEQFMHADWSSPGQLIIVLPETGFMADYPDWSGDALNYQSHNRVADFEHFARSGLDGFRMSDQLQSNFMGNVDHEVIGILPTGLKTISWMAIPAIRHYGDSCEFFRNPETAEFVQLMKELNGDYRPEYDNVVDYPGFD